MCGQIASQAEQRQNNLLYLPGRLKPVQLSCVVHYQAFSLAVYGKYFIC